jgi:hypothetical protein
MRSDLVKRNCSGAKRQRGSDDDEARRLVEDDGLETAKAENADKERQAEFCTAEAD